MKRGRRFVIFLLALIGVAIVWRAHRRDGFRQGPPLSAGGQAAAAPDAVAPLASLQQTSDCKTAVGFRVMNIQHRNVAVWYPTTARPAQYFYASRFSGLVAKDAPPARACNQAVPLVVFSHGDLGCGIQSVSFTEELARNGYVVAAPDHADAALCHTVPAEGAERTPQPSQPSFLRVEDWNESSRADRRQDVESVINELLRSEEFREVIDAREIGLAGHSLGGYTVVGMAGGWPSWRDTRVRAVLAFSPYVMPFQVRNTLSNVRVPLMYQGGTLDMGITPFLKGPKGAYAAANWPAYFVELREATHLAWANCGDERDTESCLAHVGNARQIAQYGVAFFNRYLKGLQEPILVTENASLAEYDFKTAPR